MTWQDELRHLDEERAAGRLSADDYQRRRAELTAQAGAEQGDRPAQGSTPDQGAPGQDAGGTQQAGTQNSPFPPAFRWDTTPRNETTEVIAPVGSGDAESAEQTQVVRTPDQPPPGPSYDDSERTQVVQARPLSPPPYGQSSYSSGGVFPAGGDQPPWTQQESAPPWMSSDPPPIQEPNTGWTVQGPETFEAEPTSPVGRIVAIVATVVVMVAIGVGAFLFFGSGGSGTTEPTEPAQAQQPQAQQPQPQPQPPPPMPAEPPGPPVADLPGRPQDLSHITDFEGVRDIGYLTPEELDAWSIAGPGGTAIQLSEEGANRLIVMAVETRNPIAARDRLADLQLQFDLDETSAATPGVRAGSTDTAPGEAPVLRRAHYLSGNYVVRVEVSGVDPTAVDDLFSEILAIQLDELPADV